MAFSSFGQGFLKAFQNQANMMGVPSTVQPTPLSPNLSLSNIGTELSKLEGPSMTMRAGALQRPDTPLSEAAREFGEVFAPPEPFEAPTVAPPPMIQAPQAVAPQVQIPGETFDQFEELTRQRMLEPFLRELEAREEEQARLQASRLQGAGLADSGVGLAAQERQREAFERARQEGTLDITTQASLTRTQAEMDIAQANTNMQLQTRLANAGFSLAAQQANSQNILQANMANAESYLRTMGLNVEQATQYRNAFMQFFTAEQQMEMMRDDIKLRALSTVFNGLLQREATFLDANTTIRGQNVSLLATAIANPVSTQTGFEAAPANMRPFSENTPNPMIQQLGANVGGVA